MPKHEGLKHETMVVKHGCLEEIVLSCSFSTLYWDLKYIIVGQSPGYVRANPRKASRDAWLRGMGGDGGLVTALDTYWTPVDI